MRLRKYRARPVRVAETSDVGTATSNNEQTEYAIKQKSTTTPAILRRIISNPNFAYQIIVIVLTLATDNMHMDRRIDTMTSKIDAIRSIADVINGTMKSVKVAAEAPRQIRNLLK